MRALIVLLLVTWSVPQRQPWPTLAEELTRHAVPIPPAIADSDKRITSYDVLDTPEWFAIGYYWQQEDGRLPGTVE